MLSSVKDDERALWNRKYGEHSHTSLEPDPFLVSAYSEFIAGAAPGSALDVAGGVGRHTLWLAERGWKVKLVDVSEVGIELARKNLAARFNYPITELPEPSMVTAEVQDLRANHDLGDKRYDLILVFFYLQRSLFPALISSLKPSGFLIYKTYTLEQQRFAGGPSHPMHLLKPNELLQAFASLQVLYYHETIRERGLAELVARKP
jgi:tellurite methyltransferase